MKKSFILFTLNFALILNQSNGQQWLHFPVGSNNFNGVKVGDLDVTGDHITIEALITPQTSTTIYYDIVTKHTNNVDCNYYFRTRDFALRTSTGFVSLLNPRQLCQDSAYHIAGTYDGDSIKYFVNGKQVASQHLTGTMVQNNLITTIGNIASYSGYFEQFIGYLDEVRIWNVARTPVELATNMFNLPNPTTQTGLLAYYKLGNSLNNLQGNVARNGVFYGSQCTQTINPFFNGNISHNFCCSSSISAAITLSGNDSILCPGDSVLLISTLASEYLWSNGATTQSIYASSFGNYKVTITDNNACTATSASIHITNDIPLANIAFLGDSILCPGDSIQLMANQGSFYSWNNGNTNKNIFAKTSGSYQVTVTDSSGCKATSTPVNLYLSNPLASISLINSDSILCIGDSVLLRANAGLQYMWSTSSTTQSIYVSQAGNYQVTVTNADNCAALSSFQNISQSFPISIINSPTTSYICNDDTLSLTCNIGTAYLWSTGSTNASIKISNAGKYFVSVTNSDGCSIVSDTINIQKSNVNVSIIAQNNTSFCSGDSCKLIASGNGIFLWSNGLTDSSFYAKISGEYSVKVTNPMGCSITSDTIQIQVHPIPIVDFTIDSVPDCDSYNITFQNTSIVEPNASFLWDLDAGGTSMLANPYYEYQAPGNYSIDLTVTSPYGCIDSKQITFQTYSYAHPVAKFSSVPSTYSYINDHVIFNNQSTSATTFLWNFGDGTTSTDVNPIHKYKEGGIYQVSLIAYSGPNCFETFESKIEIIILQLPNVFTPNNDGINDQFPGINILGEMNQFEMQIFNRWGQRIFLSNDSTYHFKGKTDAGNICPDGVYVYILSFNTETGLRINKTGFFQILR